MDENCNSLSNIYMLSNLSNKYLIMIIVIKWLNISKMYHFLILLKTISLEIRNFVKIFFLKTKSAKKIIIESKRIQFTISFW